MAALETLVGIGSLFGGLFGKKSGGGQQAYDTTEASLGSTSTTATENTTSTGTEAVTSTQNDSTKVVGTGQTKNFSDPVLAAIDQQLQATLKNSGVGTAQAALQKQMRAVDAMDPTKQANAVANAAEMKLKQSMNLDVNSMESNIGGTTGGNSMLALLKNQMAADNATTVAGVRSTALQEATSAKTENLAALSQTAAGLVHGLLGATSGAVQNSTNNQQQTGTQTGVQNTNSNNTTAATGTQSSNTVSLTDTDLSSTADGPTDTILAVQDKLGVKPPAPPTTPPPSTGGGFTDPNRNPGAGYVWNVPQKRWIKPIRHGRD